MPTLALLVAACRSVFCSCIFWLLFSDVWYDFVTWWKYLCRMIVETATQLFKRVQVVIGLWISAAADARSAFGLTACCTVDCRSIHDVPALTVCRSAILATSHLIHHTGLATELWHTTAVLIYTVGHKKRDSKLLSITLANLKQFW